MTKREFLDTVFALAPKEANAIMDAFDEYVESNKKIDCDKMDKCEKLQLPPANCSEFPNNSDTISRQAAIDALKMNIDIIPFTRAKQYVREALDTVLKRLEELPSVGLGESAVWYKPTGMMPPEFTGQYRCSNCGELAMRDWKHHRQTLTNFCPNCGKPMKNGGDNEPRANGHWIKDNRPGVVLPFMCSECEQRVVWRSKFCPGCGADMREVEHDSNLHAE